MATILVVDDQADYRATISAILEHEGHRMLQAVNGVQALERARQDVVDLVLLDLKLPPTDGLAVLEDLKKAAPDLPVIMLTAFGEVATAVDAMRRGAADYLLKSSDNDELLIRIQKALEMRRMVQEAQVYRTLSERAPAPVLVAEGPAMKRVQEQIRQVSGTNLTVIIIGESGTGKEVVARLIHHESPRRARPFVPLDCGALPETLIESELFGYERGAFTGAQRRKPGYFEMAFQGTLFLDEIGNLSLASQAKLLRALEQRVIQRLGGTQAVSTDVRVIAATNVDLHVAAQENRFRVDLLHRLEEFAIVLPPLRERTEDIVPLARHFLDQSMADLGKRLSGLAPETEDALKTYRWPGNIRELKNCVMQAALLAEPGSAIQPQHLRIQLRVTAPLAPASGAAAPTWTMPMASTTLKRSTQEMERQMIVEALQHTKNNRSKAARLLGLPRSVFYEKLKKYNLK